MTNIETGAKGAVVQALRAAVYKSGKTIKQLAGEAGIGSERSWPMILDGRAKLATTWILPFCKVTGADPAHLLRTWLTEYMPQLMQLLNELGTPLPLTANELRLIESLRLLTMDTDAQVVMADGRDLLAVVMVWRTSSAGPAMTTSSSLGTAAPVRSHLRNPDRHVYRWAGDIDTSINLARRSTPQLLGAPRTR